MKLTDDELEVRRPVWEALSELYLDTEPDWSGVARTCAASPYTPWQIRRILYDEVHPVLHLNLWSVAGVWDGFDQEWLVSSILARKRPPLLRLPWPEVRRYPWRKLVPLLAAEREDSGPAP